MGPDLDPVGYPDPIIVSDLQDVNNYLFSKFLCLLFFEGTFP